LEDRTAAWAHGVAGVKYRATFPHPAGTQIGELWAYPVGDRVLLLSYLTDDPGLPLQEAALAPGRIAAALIRWEVP
jgi:hypothetical protein